MASSPALILVIIFGLLAFILLIYQLFLSLSLKKYSGTKSGSGTSSLLYYQIISVSNENYYLSDAFGPEDELKSYSFDLVPTPPATIEVVHTLKSTAKSKDINTWWGFVQDPNGSEKYRIKSLLTGNYVNFKKEEIFNPDYGVKLFTYMTVDDPVLGDPNVDPLGWFVFIKASTTKTSKGYRYKIKALGLEDFYLVTDTNWDGRNYSDYDHYWYGQNQRSPIQIYPVHIKKNGTEKFYIQKNFPFSADNL